MPVLASFMVPHPPLIVPEVGRGGEKQVEKTIRSYERVAEEIASLSPETIIITSPHATLYADYFHISPGKHAKGSFAGFRAPGVKFSEDYDEDLVDKISEIAYSEDFPCGTLGEEEPELDHGTMVRNKYKGGKIVRIGLSGLPLTDHYKLGMILSRAIDALGRKTVIVGSGDLSHKLQDYGPYGFAKEGPQYDERIMDVMGRGAFGELFGFDEAFCDKAAECGHRSFVIMAGAWDGKKVRVEKLSHEDVTGVGYGICTFYPDGDEKDPERRFLEIHLKEKEKEIQEQIASSDAYVRLARKTIDTYIRTGEIIKPEEIGPTEKNLAREIVRNAISASTRDPRFDPIREDELPWLEINVDVLGEPEDIDSEDQLDVKRYGVIVSTRDGRRGLLLPDLDGVDTPEEQVSIAMHKGGIQPHENYFLQRFEVVRHI